MEIAGHTIGVCSWSLRCANLAELADRMRELEIGHVQLALGPLLELDSNQRLEQVRFLRDAGIVTTAGMIGFAGEDYSTIAAIRESGGLVPDGLWPVRRERALAAGLAAAEMAIDQVSTHLGFIPPSSDPAYTVLISRLREIAAAYSDQGIGVLLETGQETAPNLLQFLNDLNSRNVHVNFDPGNMILYGVGDPIEAIGILDRHIRHVHVKDAVLSDQPRTRWGTEVPFGTGQVNPKAFLSALHSVGYTGPLIIEREAGPNRFADVRAAIVALAEAAG